MYIETARFGKIKYAKTEVITMVRSLFGFDDRVRFIVVSLKRQEPFKWLQSLEDPDLAFLIIDPLYFKPDYVVEVNPDDLVVLKAKDSGEIAIFVLVSIPQDHPELMSANLLAPLIINKANMNGAQLVLNESAYTADQSIFGELSEKLHKAPVGSEN